MYIIKMQKIFKSYGREKNKVVALNNINLTIKKGEFVAIIGASGSGKSTLMNILGAMDKPDSGNVIINNFNLGCLKEEELTKFRRESIGFVFQFYNLLPALTVKENILLPALIAGNKNNSYETLVLNLKLKEKEQLLPDDLSGGQAQRVAIARALINKPLLLLADEPTGHLDSVNAKKIMSIFESYNKLGQTIIFVTHDMSLARRARRLIIMKDGKIIKDKINEKHYSK